MTKCVAHVELLHVYGRLYQYRTMKSSSFYTERNRRMCRTSWITGRYNPMERQWLPRNLELKVFYGCYMRVRLQAYMFIWAMLLVGNHPDDLGQLRTHYIMSRSGPLPVIFTILLRL